MRSRTVLLLVAGAIMGAIATAILLVPSPDKAKSSKQIATPISKGSPSSISSSIDYPVEKRKSIPSSDVTEPSDGEDQLLPVEWEEPFLDVMSKNGQSMDERNSRLIDLATNKAIGVPKVQEECMRHLAYGLRSDQKSEFYMLATNKDIPIEIRKRFLGFVFDMGRSDEFIAWLCRSLRSHGDPEIISFAKERIQNFGEI